MIHHLLPEENGIRPCHHVLPKELSRTQTLVAEIEHIHQHLVAAASLEPGPHVNLIFTKLVQMCITVHDHSTVTAVLRHPTIQGIMPSLRRLCSEGEYLLERHWAEELVYLARHDRQLCNIKQGTETDHGSVVQDILSSFVYYDNYQGLTRLELNALKGVGARLSHITFVGSGPLPMSSFLMALQSDDIKRIDNIDKSKEAIVISSQLSDALGLQDKLRYFEQEADSYLGYSEADVIVLGALVGNDGTEKTSFLCHVVSQMKSGAVVLVRSAHSLRKILYPSIEASQLSICGLEPLIELHPHNDIVNSVLIARRI
ncbi:Nicotianamine synthase [Radiomyces spectabilis]|uniref:Nicotianamine synthase n=1 Tax=Radiomyces spectabilis TaxID=64574 RepID=UPI00221FCA97|nr:Nicotianamine synthase [Radiomyces spectabilis]KAI8388503.1 Nicotianamine synthase [Radiomyces spectabilis]